MSTGDRELTRPPMFLEESAQSIGGVLFDAELAVAEMAQKELSEDLTSHPIKCSVSQDTTPSRDSINGPLLSPKLEAVSTPGVLKVKQEAKSNDRSPESSELTRVPTEIVMGTAWTKEVRLYNCS